MCIRDSYKNYLKIPENAKLFNDILIKNALVEGKKVTIAAQFQEKLVNERIIFVPKIEKIGNVEEKFGHKYVEANNTNILTANGEPIFEGYENDIVLINNELFLLKP